MYSWQDHYSSTAQNDGFLKGILQLLNDGTSYTDVNGLEVGHIKLIDGPVGPITIISYTFYTTPVDRCILINILYTGRLVCNYLLDSSSAIQSDLINGHWANVVQAYKLSK